MAKWLLENGVFMGFRFVMDEENGAGYEDVDFQTLNVYLLKNLIWWSDWAAYARVYGQVRQRFSPWGFKDPAASMLIRQYRTVYPGAVFIRCIRDKSEVVESCMRCYNWDEERAELMHDSRVMALDAGLEGARYIDVHLDDVRANEEAVNDAVRDWLKETINVDVYSLAREGGLSAPEEYARQAV